MKTLELTKATAPLSQYARTMRKEGPVIITAHGKPIAALVLITNADVETIRLSTDPKFLALIRRSRSRHKAEGGLSSDEMRHRLGLKPHGRRNGR